MGNLECKYFRKIIYSYDREKTYDQVIHHNDHQFLESSQPMYEFRVAFKIAHDSAQREDVFPKWNIWSPPRMRKYLLAS